MESAVILKYYKNNIDNFMVTLSSKNKKYKVLMEDIDPHNFGDVCFAKQYNTLEEAEDVFDRLLKGEPLDSNI